MTYQSVSPTNKHHLPPSKAVHQQGQRVTVDESTDHSLTLIFADSLPPNIFLGLPSQNITIQLIIFTIHIDIFCFSLV